MDRSELSVQHFPCFGNFQLSPRLTLERNQSKSYNLNIRESQIAQLKNLFGGKYFLPAIKKKSD